MPTPTEIAAAVKALHARREASRTRLTPWPEIEEEVRIVLEAAEAARAGDQRLPVTKITPQE